MAQTYRYLVNPSGEHFDESKIVWPGHIGTWPPSNHSSSSLLTIVTEGSRIEDGVIAVKTAYPGAVVFDNHADAVTAQLGNIILPPIHLGRGEEGQRRKESLERLAAEAGHFWNGKPSVGRWLVALADQKTAQ